MRDRCFFVFSFFTFGLRILIIFCLDSKGTRALTSPVSSKRRHHKSGAVRARGRYDYKRLSASVSAR